MPEPSDVPTGPPPQGERPSVGERAGEGSRPACLDDLEDLRGELLEELPAAVADELHRAKATGEPLLRVQGVARRLNVSKRTVERLVADGELRPLWIKGQRRFTPAAVDAYLRTSAAPGGRRGAEA